MLARRSPLLACVLTVGAPACEASRAASVQTAEVGVSAPPSASSAAGAQPSTAHGASETPFDSTAPPSRGPAPTTSPQETPQTLADCPQWGPGAPQGRVASPEIDEASGLVASRRNPGLLWVHNDSGDTARLFAVRTDGTLVGIFTAPTLQAVDWEDIAIGPGKEGPEPHLYIADMGDNARRRNSVFLHRVPEPALPSNATDVVQGTLGPVETFRVRYPDGPHDVETLLVEPTTGEVVVLTKALLRAPRMFFTSILRHPFTILEAGGPLDLDAIDVPALLPTAGDVSPDGRWVMVRSYNAAYLLRRQSGQPLHRVFTSPACEVPLAREPQGEALSFSADGRGYFTLSEGRHQPIYFYALDPARHD